MPPIKRNKFTPAKRDAAIETLRSACARFRAKMRTSSNDLDVPYFGKTGLGNVLGDDRRHLEEILLHMEKNGWARKTGYKDTYEIF